MLLTSAREAVYQKVLVKCIRRWMGSIWADMQFFAWSVQNMELYGDVT